MIVSIVVAMGLPNRVIGAKGDLPWHLPNDLKHFKELTFGRTVIMGRSTYESIYRRLRGPLPYRKNIVLSRNPEYYAKGCVVTHSLMEALEAAKDEDEVFVIGGAWLFNDVIAITDRMYITFVHEHFFGDVFFPEIDASKWQMTYFKTFASDDKNCSHSFAVFEKLLNGR